MMKQRINNNESGVALVFAIGLLALLLMVGLAFVSNAVNYRRAAENNSARSQSRMFALSAVSRTVSSLVAHSHQYAKKNEGQPPETFDAVYSFAKYDADGAVSAGGTYTYTDGLLGEYSSMLLPASSHVVTTPVAMRFNQQFKGAEWQGNWVFFTNGQSGSDRRIVGRAAWQVICSPAQLLAPVFFRGHLEEIDADSDFIARENRWGREIDEVFLDSASAGYTTLTNVTSSDKLSATAKMLDYDVIYSLTNAPGDAETRRWIEKWFFPDFSESKTMANPSHYFWESYDGLLRFNISELHQKEVNGGSWEENYDVNDGADQWYARFDIDSTLNDVNNENAVKLLTQDGLLFDGNLSYDFQYFEEYDGSNGLPYLRKIGNESENFTFKDDSGNKNIAALRKQIAANFNDYCDADGIPTSDVNAKNWRNDMDSDGFKNPTYTGNEKTPYLYELGMLFKISANGTDGALVFDLDENGSVVGNTMVFNASPIVKLVNIYPFDAANGGYQNIRGEITPGAMDVRFKANKVILKDVEFEYKVLETVGGVAQEVTKTGKVDLSVDLASYTNGFSDLLALKAKVASGKIKCQESTPGVQDEVYVDFSSNAENKNGENPYPFGYSKDKKWMKTSADAASGDVVLTTAADGNIEIAPEDAALSLPSGVALANGTVFPADFGSRVENSEKITAFGDLQIDSISASQVSANIRRAVLSAELTGDLSVPKGAVAGDRAGIDYAKFDFADDSLPTWVLGSAQEFAFGTAAADHVIALGGIKNYDPRQNLNHGDWYFDPRSGSGENYDEAAVAAMEVGSISAGKVNSDTANAGNVEMKPNHTNHANKDDEEVEEPAYKDASHYISTAVIRNAPMMSPWEIGFIHRGIRWQTINLKEAQSINHDSLDSESNFTSTDWSAVGVRYDQGDAAILEEIKMTDQTHTYGKIDINMLRTSHQDYSEKDKDIARALFSNIRYGEDRWTFIQNSTRDNNGNFPDPVNSGLRIGGTGGADLEDIVNNFINDRSEVSGKINFINYETSSGFCLANAFTDLGSSHLNNDAAQEEIVGKTINLICADTGSPAVVNVMIVAQSIRDVEGTQVRITDETDKSRFTNPYGSVSDIEDGMVTMDGCRLGRFDVYQHLDESGKDVGKSVYFDEITGEVRIFVRLYHRNNGRLVIDRIDYL